MTQNVHFDAIVVGSGISGGWAAKELTEKGLKVLVLERGKFVQHGSDYKGEHLPPWKIPYRGMPLRELYESEYPIQSKVHAFDETTRHFFNNDKDNPYVHRANSPFHWIRADALGGRSLLWGRQVYRWSDLDFKANKRDGHGIDWPVRYHEIAPWYSYVEKFIGVSGQSLGLPYLPDGEFQSPMPMNVVERAVKARIEERFTGRIMTIGRCAVLTEPMGDRAACHYCGPCHRGCSTGSYFSSLSSTLPAAKKTGRLTIRTDSVVEKLEYDPESGRVSGAWVIDASTKERTLYTSRLMFLCASTIASTQILLNSRCKNFPNGLANRSGVLGHYLMDHIHEVGAMGIIPGFMDKYTIGNRPNGIYIPRFRNLGEDEGNVFLRGYGFQGGAMRITWNGMHKQIGGFGRSFKKAMRSPGPWMFFLAGFGEHLPDKNNRLYLNHRKLDKFGIPQVEFNCSFGENEARMRKDIIQEAMSMLQAAEAVGVTPFDSGSPPGGAIHEVGTARMGDDPTQSVLNRWNQAHDVPNLFVTDGSFMASSSCVNPSLTYMAFTTRACDYAADQLRAGAL